MEDDCWLCSSGGERCLSEKETRTEISTPVVLWLFRWYRYRVILKNMKRLRRLRQLALIEGGSFIVLLFVAMPLKYFAGLPLAVKIVGLVHGILFMLVVLALVQVMITVRWPMGRGLLVFISALVPFGPFLLDRRMRGYESEADRG